MEKRLSRPTVSVIIPTYNRETLLPRALDSVVAQTYEDWEIVLIDDGSTDGTATLSARYAARLGHRFLLVRQPNRGSSMARNAGIDACRGRFVAFLDSDDEFLPTKLQRQLALFDRCPELGFVYGDCAFIDLDGVRYESIFDTVAPLAREVLHESVDTGLCVCTEDPFDVLIRGYFIPTIVGMIRREVLGSSIRFPVGQAYAEEWLFYLKVVKSCAAGFVDEPLCLHHHTEGSLARTDRHRNSVRLRGLLKAIGSTFVDLTRAQHRTVDRQLAAVCRQLGYESFRAAQYGQALRRFSEALYRDPGVGVLAHVLEAGLRWLLPVGKRSPNQHVKETRVSAS